MVIINTIGGVGNQMFQYAFAYALSQRNKKTMKIDISNFDSYDLRTFELNYFNISPEIATIEEINQLKYKSESWPLKQLRKLRRLPPRLSKDYYQEAHFHFDKNALSLGKDVYFEGYWQSEKYFYDFRNDLLEQFTLTEAVSSKAQKYEQLIENSESVSLHIRRGDYVSNTLTNDYHGTCGINYYKNAILNIKEKANDSHFFIFSDDLIWAKANLNFIDNITFIELDSGAPDIEEMYLMSCCNHNIIANSSFSWWGAWLNKNTEKKVIAPSKWFNDESLDTKDLLPEGWTVIDERN
jgi:hypothetical protein